MNIEGKEKALFIVQAALDKKADNPVILEVKNQSDVTDFYVICSSDSVRGVQTVSDHIEKSLKENKIKIFNIEGYSQGNWVLIDTSDVVTHIFYKDLRDFYDLEGLWIDSNRIPIPDNLGIASQA